MTEASVETQAGYSTDMAEDPLIGDVAELLMMWGIPLTPARLFGHLLLQSEPVSLDQISKNLGISKSTASDAARQMEQFGFLRRYGTPGTKQVRFAPSEYVSGFYRKQVVYFKKMSGLFGARLSSDETPAAFKDRFEKMSKFYSRLAQSMEEAINEFE